MGTSEAKTQQERAGWQSWKRFSLAPGEEFQTALTAPLVPQQVVSEIGVRVDGDSVGEARVRVRLADGDTIVRDLGPGARPIIRPTGKVFFTGLTITAPNGASGDYAERFELAPRAGDST